ncbi:MAG: hypothetical protein AB9866_29615 [Syntrophobacteraceae bacterium]
MPEVPDKVASETPTGYSKMAIQIAIEEDEDTECSFAARTTYFTSWNPYSDECSSCIESWSFSHENNLSIEKTIDVSTSAPSDIIIYLCDFFKSRMEEQNQYIGYEYTQYFYEDDPPGTALTRETLDYKGYKYKATISDVKITGGFSPALLLLFQ